MGVCSASHRAEPVINGACPSNSAQQAHQSGLLVPVDKQNYSDGQCGYLCGVESQVEAGENAKGPSPRLQ